MNNVDEIILIQNMIKVLKDNLNKTYLPGKTKRDAHPKSLGLLKATFSICDNLPNDLKIGIFKEAKQYSALIRISSSNGKIQSDAVKDLRGFSIKLLNVEGKKFSCDEKSTQDFVLISNPTMPLGTIKLFHDAIYYSLKWNPLIFASKLIFSGKGKILLQLNKARKNQTSPLDIQYWSTTPYLYGDKIVKYSIIPKSIYKSILPKKLTENYLTDNMQKHLSNEDATFDFMIQFYNNDQSTPIDDASIEWNESDSKFIKVAEIKIPKQNFISSKRDNVSEILSFTPGHCLTVHKPIGGLNRARIKIYKSLSKYRHDRNNKPLFEPTKTDFSNL